MLSTFGVPVAGVWGVVVAMWTSAAGDWPVNKRFLLVVSAVILSLAAVGVWWILKQRRKLLLAEAASSAPFKVCDAYDFDTKAGYYVERKTGAKARVCAKCLMPPTKIVSPLFEAVGSGIEIEYVPVWRCGICGTDYFRKN